MSTRTGNNEKPRGDGTWCIFHGGPADGTHGPTAENYCTRRIVIFSLSGTQLTHPAVYLRDDTKRGEYEHRGLDGVVRTFASLGYNFERRVDMNVALEIDNVRRGGLRAETTE